MNNKTKKKDATKKQEVSLCVRHEDDKHCEKTTTRRIGKTRNMNEVRNGEYRIKRIRTDGREGG